MAKLEQLLQEVRAQLGGDFRLDRHRGNGRHLDCGWIGQSRI
jgi:hypothetical protein